MTLYLPLFALVLAGGAFVLGRRDFPRARPPLLGVIFLLLLLGAGAKLASKYGAASDLGPGVFGLVAGMILVMLSEWIGIEAVAVCLGVALGAAGFRFSSESSVVQLAILVGGMAAMLLSGKGRVASITVVTAAGVAAVNAVGRIAVHEPAAVSLGSVIGLFIAAGALVSLAAGKRIWSLPLVLLVIVAGIVLTIHRLLPDASILMPALLGVATGAVVVFLLSDTEPDSLRSGVAVVLWLGLGALTVATSKGLGMSVALLGGLALPLAMGRTRALLSAGPLFGLVLFRYWRARSGSVDDTLDSRDIYAMVGLVFGAVIPVLAEEWSDRALLAKFKSAGSWGGLIWGVLLFGLPWVLMTVISSNASDGFVVGLGFSVLGFMNRQAVTARPLAILCGLAAAAMFTDKWTAATAELSRADRIHFITYAAIAIVVLSIPLAFLVRPQTAKAEA